MEIRTYKVYKYEELPRESQLKALEKWREQNDYTFLSEVLHERAHGLFEDNKITALKNGYNDDYAVMYSLDNCQGDGVMFEGHFTWNKYPNYEIAIKQSGHYYHSNSKNITIEDNDGNEADDKVYQEFEEVYQSICKTLENDGYAFIDNENEEANIIETFNANEYLFTLEGIID